MQIAEIVPVSCLDLIKDKPYHMCLAQLVLKNKEYADFYRKRAEEGKYVILDNGSAEGETLSFTDLYKAYEIIQPTEIILPDVLFDSLRTRKRSISFYLNYVKNRMSCRVMIVPQGKDLPEWIQCLDDMLQEIDACTVGVPKWLGHQNRLYRVAASGYLSQFRQEVHLLGCSENPEVLNLCKEINEHVRGCDSAYSYLCAKASINTITPNTTRPNEKIDFLNDPKIESLSNLMKDMEGIVK